MANRWSVASGLASNVATWNGGTTVPVSGDRVLISVGHTVELDGTYEWGDDSTSTITVNGVSTTASIFVAGTLKASRTVNSQLTCVGDLRIHTTGILDYGRTTAGSGVNDLIPLGVTATLVLNKSSAPVSAKYGYTTAAGAQWYAAGAARNPNARLTSTAGAGATSIEVDQMDGWQVGDRIGIASTNISSFGQFEERTISGAITGSGPYTVPLSSALSFQHLATGPVCTFSSNVIITSHAAATPGYGHQYWEAAQAVLTREASNVLFENLGQRSHATTARWSGLSINPQQFSSSANLTPLRVKGCMFWARGNTLSPGVTSHGVRQRTTIEDCAFAISTSHMAIYEAGGTILDFINPYVVSCSSWMESGYSQGGQNCRHYGAVLSGFGGATALGSAIGPEFYDCDFVACGRVAHFGAAPSARFERCKFGSIGLSNGEHFTNSYQGTFVTADLIDCTFVAGKHVVNVTNAGNRIQDAASSSRVRVANKEGDPLQQEVYFPGGVIARDNTFGRTGASLRMSPHNANEPFSFDLSVFAPQNMPVAVSGYIYVNTAYGTSNPVTVTLSGLGITPSVWTENTAIRDGWQQFIVAATNLGADGMLKLTVTVRGTAGAVWVDSLSAPTPVAVNTGDFEYWNDALPVSVVTANFVSAVDVWNVLSSDTTLPGSLGERMATMLDAAVSSRLASAGYIAPDNAGISAIDARLPTDPADQSAVAALIAAIPAAPDAITVAGAVLTAAQSTPIHANVQQINDAPVAGSGTSGDKWRGI